MTSRRATNRNSSLLKVSFHWVRGVLWSFVPCALQNRLINDPQETNAFNLPLAVQKSPLSSQFSPVLLGNSLTIRHWSCYSYREMSCLFLPADQSQERVRQIARTKLSFPILLFSCVSLNVQTHSDSSILAIAPVLFDSLVHCNSRALSNVEHVEEKLLNCVLLSAAIKFEERKEDVNMPLRASIMGAEQTVLLKASIASNQTQDRPP